MARVLLRVESRTGVGKFSLHMQGSSYVGPGWSGHRFSAGAEVFLTVAVI